jgi:hypothetical protein
VAVMLIGLLAGGATGCSDESSSPTTTRDGADTDAVTVTTSVDADPAELGEQILVAAGARDVVAAGQGAEERLTGLAVSWCETAAASDVENADSVFRFALNEYVADWGRPRTGGEVQDVRLALAMLAGELATPLAVASNELLCPEIDRPEIDRPEIDRP